MSASTTERAAQIRAELKRRGVTARQVSVTSDYYSMGSSIRIRIKDARVPSAAVRAIAEPHESIDRDQFGEILSGGNRFVDISYESDAMKAIGAPYVDRVRKAHELRTDAGDNSLIPVEGTNYLIGQGRHGYGLAVWQGGDHGSHVQETNTIEGAAQCIGLRILNEKVSLPEPPVDGPRRRTVDAPTVSVNAEKAGVEIRFPSKPADAILSTLKANGWRWSRFASCWYHRDTADARAFAERLIAS